MISETANQVPPLKERVKGSAIFLFVLAALVIYLFVFLGGSAAWFLEQNALASESLAVLGKAGIVWFLLQAIILAVACWIGVSVSKSIFRPVYRTWLIASLITLPALALRFVGPNNDQVGALIQILIGLGAGAAVLFFRRLSFRFDRRSLFVFAIVPFGIWPFLLWGAFGSGTDIVLNLLTGLAFGLLASSLVVTTESNTFLNGLGIAVLLAILGSAFGYDGGQLLLIVILPMFGFALGSIASSVSAMTVGIGLLAAAPLIFIDPTELTIVLGDLLPWAMIASFSMMGLGILVSLAVWIGGRWKARPTVNPYIAAASNLGTGDRYLRSFWLAWFLWRSPLRNIEEPGGSFPGKLGGRPALHAEALSTRLLTNEANSTQQGLRQTLDRFGIHYTPYYLVNAIEVDGSALVRLYLLSRPEVDKSFRARGSAPSRSSAGR